MAIEKVKAYFRQFGIEGRIQAAEQEKSRLLQKQ